MGIPPDLLQLADFGIDVTRVHRPITNDGEPLDDVYNKELGLLAEKNKNTWLTVPWLYSEYVSDFSLRNKMEAHSCHQMLLVRLSMERLYYIFSS